MVGLIFKPKVEMKEADDESFWLIKHDSVLRCIALLLDLVTL